MGKLQAFLKILMFLGSIAFSGIFIVFGLFFSSPTGLFSAPHTTLERLTGFISLFIGLAGFILSFSLFRRKFDRSFISLVALISLATLFGFIFMGFGQDITILFIPFIILMFVFYALIKKINRDGPTKKVKNPKINKDSAFLLIPILILALVFFYFKYVTVWIHKTNNETYANKIADKFGYQRYIPKYIPAGYSKKETYIGGAKSDYFFTEYKTSDGNWFTIAQFVKPRSLNLNPPNCSIHGSSQDNFEVFYGSSMSSGINSECNEIRSVNGINIYIMKNPLSSGRNYAVALKGNTLISIDGFNFPQEELAKLLDSLENIKK